MLERLLGVSHPSRAQALPRSSRSLLPALASDTDTLTPIHMLGGTHPDTRLHRHTPAYTAHLPAAHHPHSPPRETATLPPASETSPRSPAFMYMTRHVRVPGSPTQRCQPLLSDTRRPPSNSSPPVATDTSGTPVLLPHAPSSRDTPFPSRCAHACAPSQTPISTHHVLVRVLSTLLEALA